MSEPERWAVDLVCCGHDDGTQIVEGSWYEADAFRESYCNAEGHKRVGVIRRAERGEQHTHLTLGQSMISGPRVGPRWGQV